MSRHYFTLLLCLPLATFCLGRSRAAADGPLLPGMENATSDGGQDVEPAPSIPSRLVPPQKLPARPAAPQTRNLDPPPRRGQANSGQTRRAAPQQRPQSRQVTPQQRFQTRQAAPQYQAPRTSPYNVPGRQPSARTQGQNSPPGRWNQPNERPGYVRRSPGGPATAAPRSTSSAQSPRAVPQYRTSVPQSGTSLPRSRSYAPQSRSSATSQRAAPSRKPSSASPPQRQTAGPQFSRQGSAAASRSRAAQTSARRRQQSSAARNAPRPPWETNRRRAR